MLLHGSSNWMAIWVLISLIFQLLLKYYA